jgi:ATP-dependent Clp endopeptidase proteolytic subunit ClpP
MFVSFVLLKWQPHIQIDPRRKDSDDKPPTNPIRMPVIDTDNGQMDVISRLLKDRILLLGQGVDDEVANVLVAQLLYLANEDPEKDITLYINSPVRVTCVYTTASNTSFVCLSIFSDSLSLSCSFHFCLSI